MTKKYAVFLPVNGIGRMLLTLLGTAALSACSILFDAPPSEADSEQALQRFNQAAKEQADSLVQQNRQRLNAAGQQWSREMAFSSPDAATSSAKLRWPVMRIEQVAPQHPPQLMLEGPIQGIVWLDEREIGWVREGSVRVVTLTAGEHNIRIEHPLAPAMSVQFYIESGERITLHWQAR